MEDFLRISLDFVGFLGTLSTIFVQFLVLIASLTPLKIMSGAEEVGTYSSDTFYYKKKDEWFGPFTEEQMQSWYRELFFTSNLQIRRNDSSQVCTLGSLIAKNGIGCPFLPQNLLMKNSEELEKLKMLAHENVEKLEIVMKENTELRAANSALNDFSKDAIAKLELTIMEISESSKKELEKMQQDLDSFRIHNHLLKMNLEDETSDTAADTAANFQNQPELLIDESAPAIPQLAQDNERETIEIPLYNQHMRPFLPPKQARKRQRIAEFEFQTGNEQLLQKACERYQLTEPPICYPCGVRSSTGSEFLLHLVSNRHLNKLYRLGMGASALDYRLLLRGA